MVEEIGARRTVGSGTVGAVLHLQHGIGLVVVARRSPDTEVVDADVAKTVEEGGITHIKHLVAITAAVEGQRGTLGIAPVVHLRTVVEHKFACNSQDTGILDREFFARHLRQSGSTHIDELAYARSVSNASQLRSGVAHVAYRSCIIQCTAFQLDILGRDGTSIIRIGAFVGGELNGSIAGDRSARQHVDEACTFRREGAGGQRVFLGDIDGSAFAHYDDIAG